MRHLAGWGAIVCTLAVALFQIALAAGLPLGAMAWGGQAQVLPVALRWASAAAATYLLLTVAVLAVRASILILPWGRGIAVWWTWILTVQLALNTAANLASQSPPERMVMAPLTAVMTLLTLVVALSPSRG